MKPSRYTITTSWRVPKWKGVRYQLDGTGNDGIDCSALTQKLFLAALNKRLPRTTGEQIKLGQHVPITSLLPGDLVFFKPRRVLRHVGVYLGNNQFIHASDKAGVTLSNYTLPSGRHDLKQQEEWMDRTENPSLFPFPICHGSQSWLSFTRMATDRSAPYQA
ncbi:TPA: hypothetical protein JAX37_004800 [Enterobacter cloacae]|nr:hypothetical protein [Enterobacter cloacae]